MSIQQNFPAITPSLSLNFARSKKLDPRITFTRTSSATRINERGLVEVVPANSPRFDHSYDSVSGSVRSLGLLVEEQRSNVTRWSEDIFSWNKNSSALVTTNQIVSPDGTLTADEVECILGGNFLGRVTTIGSFLSVDLNGSFSFFAKYNNNPWISASINMFISGGGEVNIVRRCWWNIQEGIVGGTTVASGGGGTLISQTIEDYGNGWYRCSAVVTPPSGHGISGAFIQPAEANTSVNAILGSKHYIWGAQLEQGSFPTSYIPTTNTTVTRTADNVSMVGENFSSWYNQSEGTVYADTRMVGVQTARFDRLWAITNSNLNLEGISVFVAGPAGTPSGYVSSVTITNSATEQVGGALVETALTTPRLKSAFAFKQNDCASAYNGQQRFVDSIVDLSTFTTPLDRLFIGQPQRFQGHSCMTISQLTYYPRRLTNSQLTNLTK